MYKFINAEILESFNKKINFHFVTGIWMHEKEIRENC